MCDYCDYDETTIHANKLTVCNKCSKQKTGIMITQSDAIKKYPITKADLENIRKVQYKGIYMTYLFLIKDIEAACVAKHGSKKAYKELMANKLIKQKEKKKHKEDSRAARKKELNDYLKSICLPGIRNDSVLCENYIEKGDKSGWTKEEIGSIMLEMSFYYDKTDYSTILYTLRGDEMRDMKEYGYGYWDDEEQVRGKAKRNALYNYVVENFDDTHKCILEVPGSLKGLFDVYYEKVKAIRLKNEEKEKRRMIVVNKNRRMVSELFSKYRESIGSRRRDIGGRIGSLRS